MEMARLRWLGHATFVFEIAGWRIVIDPWITNPVSPYRSLDAFVKEYPELDLIIVTHDHGDHVGDSVEILKRYPKAKIAALYELANHIAKESGAPDRAIPANIGGPVKLNGLEIVFTPAHHSSTIGDPSGVVVLGEGKAVYHAGDTGLLAEMQLISELYRPAVALLPIGGHFTMGIREAAKAVELLKPKYVVPMHYGTFDVIKADPNEFAKLVRERVPETQVIILKPGEYLEF